MIIHTLTLDDFQKYIPRVKCINLFHYKLLDTAKLKEMTSVERLVLEGADDIESLGNYNLVWYVDKNNQRAYWNAPGARNLRLAEEAERMKDGMDENMFALVENIRGGLKSAIEIVAVYDTLLGESVIVDGVQRAIAFYYLYLTDRAAIEDLFGSGHSISCVRLSSPAGSLIFPCDFVNICRDATALS